MSEHSLGSRQQALARRFFADPGPTRAQLAARAGIGDEEVLDRLLELGVGAETWIALTLVPLIEVAWADGHIDPEERDAILAAADADGVARGTAAHGQLEAWLMGRPGPELLGSWFAMASALCERFAGAERAALRAEVMRRALRIAEATGGEDGDDPVCAQEREILARLEKAFR